MSTPIGGLRTATAADAAALSRLAHAAYGKYTQRLGYDVLPMRADYGKIVAEDQVWVIDGSAGECDATLILRPAANHLLIWSVAVGPALQKKGLGRALMKFAEDEARRQGLSEMRLFTNELMSENIALYRRLGYSESHRERRPDRVVVHMRKALSVSRG
jgi:GNAT superfamily N-acetyltransferase